MPTKKPKRDPGRPRVDPQEDTVTMNIRFSASQREKIDRNGGGPWVRKLVDKARDKPADPARIPPKAPAS